MGRPGAGQRLPLSTVLEGLAGRGELACALGRFTERFCRFFHDGSRLLLLLASSADVAWVRSASVAEAPSVQTVLQKGTILPSF